MDDIIFRAEITGVRKRLFDIPGYRVTICAPGLEELSLNMDEAPMVGAAYDVILRPVASES